MIFSPLSFQFSTPVQPTSIFYTRTGTRDEQTRGWNALNVKITGIAWSFLSVFKLSSDIMATCTSASFFCGWCSFGACNFNGRSVVMVLSVRRAFFIPALRVKSLGKLLYANVVLNLNLEIGQCCNFTLTSSNIRRESILIFLVD